MNDITSVDYLASLKSAAGALKDCDDVFTLRTLALALHNLLATEFADARDIQDRVEAQLNRGGGVTVWSLRPEFLAVCDAVLAAVEHKAAADADRAEES